MDPKRALTSPLHLPSQLTPLHLLIIPLSKSPLINSMAGTFFNGLDQVIRGRGKICFIDGTVQEPALTDPSYSSWDTDNALVMAWLINSMEEHIGSLYLVHNMTKAIWDKV